MYGSGFMLGPGLQCRFGDQTVNYHEFIDAGHIVCISPSRVSDSTISSPILPNNGRVHVEIAIDGKPKNLFHFLFLSRTNCI